MKNQLVNNMYRKRLTCIFAVLMLWNLSCKKRFLDHKELSIYISEPANGLLKTVQQGQIKAELFYQPKDMLSRANAENSNNLYFILNLSANGKEVLRQLKFSEYSELVQTLAFRMPEFSTISTEQVKAFHAKTCYFNQTYGLGKSNQLLVTFEQKNILSSDEIHIKIKEFGLNIGDLDFTFKTSDIKNTPHLSR